MFVAALQIIPGFQCRLVALVALVLDVPYEPKQPLHARLEEQPDGDSRTPGFVTGKQPALESGLFPMPHKCFGSSYEV